MWAIATLAGLVGLIILALCMPLDLAFRVDMDGKPKFRLRLVWLFGLVGKEVKRGEKKPEDKKNAAEEKLRKKRRRIGFRTILRILRTKGLLKQLKELVRDIFAQLKVRDLVVNLRVSLDNPADIGLLFALIGPATLYLNSLTAHKIRVQPAFGDEAVLEGFSHGNVRLQPIRLVVPFVKSAFSLATLRALKTLALGKWKRRK